MRTELCSSFWTWANPGHSAGRLRRLRNPRRRRSVAVIYRSCFWLGPRKKYIAVASGSQKHAPTQTASIRTSSLRYSTSSCGTFFMPTWQGAIKWTRKSLYNKNAAAALGYILTSCCQRFLTLNRSRGKFPDPFKVEAQIERPYSHDSQLYGGATLFRAAFICHFTTLACFSMLYCNHMEYSCQFFLKFIVTSTTPDRYTKVLWTEKRVLLFTDKSTQLFRRPLRSSTSSLTYC